MSEPTDGSLPKPNHEAVRAWVVKGLLGLLVPAIAYIALQTVSKPYYAVGKKLFIETNAYQTVFVVNPGPWKTRHPEIEFSTLAPVTIIDYSAGVSVTKKTNKQTAAMDNGLAPGCSFFITYKFSPNPNSDSSPRIVCDGKQCKDAPTFDPDVVMWILIVVGIVTSLVAVVSVWQQLETWNELKKEKASTINKAVSALIDRCSAQADVAESVNALASFISGKGPEVKSMPLKSDGGRHKKTPPGTKPPVVLAEG